MENKLITEQLNPDFSSALYQVFEIEKKLKKLTTEHTIHRNVDKLKDYFQSLGWFYEIPKGTYNETRTDCDAHISSDSPEELVISEVIKPTIRYRENESSPSRIVRRATVIVESKGIQEEASETITEKPSMITSNIKICKFIKEQFSRIKLIFKGNNVSSN
ncbi:MAG: hypothetical protein F6J90_25065 [Moorea sp. SIOASIH]|uniref:hypothetical protein n=1 Tax=Moorena sp. SIOASIH TaxID=2607817 RepID=UPI0013BBFBA0|nr:hypothetical protein [Moorena sp. SIOASIH]NEO39423.1 hypothetical protein [Moorena sp. SIOASIH]